MLTGKGITWGGSRVRKEATGYGTVFFVDEMLKTRGESFDGKRVRRLRLRQRRHLCDREGAPARWHRRGLLRLRPATSSTRRASTSSSSRRSRRCGASRICEYADARGDGHLRRRRLDLGRPLRCRAAIGDRERARRGRRRTLAKNGVRVVAEGANMPTTPAGIKVFSEAGVLFGPGKAANAGGVATSALEMQQNASRDSWTAEHTEARLAEIMRDIHHSCATTAEEYGAPGDYVAGANIAGFVRVADAMLAQGVI